MHHAMAPVRNSHAWPVSFVYIWSLKVSPGILRRWNLKKCQLSYIVVGDRCWRRNLLVTDFHYIEIITSIRKKRRSHNDYVTKWYWQYICWIFCPEMTLAQFPKSKFWNFCWIFCPEMTLAQFPEFGFFVQNSRIGVKSVTIIKSPT